jgi:hypothetical protein
MMECSSHEVRVFGDSAMLALMGKASEFAGSAITSNSPMSDRIGRLLEDTFTRPKVL